MPDGVAPLVRCSKCGESKPPSDFYRDRGRPSGLHSYCKACNCAARDAWRRLPGSMEKAAAATERRLDARAAPGTKRAMRHALRRIVAQIYDRDGELTAETAEICGQIARSALGGEAE